MIPLFKVFMPESVEKPLMETLFSGFIGQGKKVDLFEKKLSDFIGAPHVLSLNSATSALQLALRLSDVGAGDEVITTPMTCTATNMPILAMGAKIVWADIDPCVGNISVESIEKKITNKTKAIVVVHWGGYPCDLEEIHSLAKKFGIRVIEDAAHAFGSTYRGEKIGNHSDFVAFSFQAIKHMTTIDGGSLFCKSKDDYQRGKLLRWYGIDRETPRKDLRCEEDIVEWGYKFHMNDIAATIGIEQLKYVEQNRKKCIENGRFYDQNLQGLSRVKTIAYSDDRESANWIYTLHVDDKSSFVEHCHQHEIMVSPVHVRNDLHTAFKPYLLNDLPGVDKFTSSMICIPVGWWVTESDREKVVDVIKAF